PSAGRVFVCAPVPGRHRALSVGTPAARLSGGQTQCSVLGDRPPAPGGDGMTTTPAPTLPPLSGDEPTRPLLEVWNLKKHFVRPRGLFGRHTRFVRAVDGVNLTLHRGRTLGLVGE